MIDYAQIQELMAQEQLVRADGTPVTQCPNCGKQGRIQTMTNEFCRHCGHDFGAHS